jgi:PknH-like extracellular domain
MIATVNASEAIGVAAGRRRRAVTAVRFVLLAAAGVCLMLTGCTVSATGHPKAAPNLGHWQRPPILAHRLGDLLLSEGDVNAVGQSKAMALRRPISEMSHTESMGADPNCLDAYSPIEAAVYQGTNWVAVEGQFLDNAHSRADSRKHALLQAVVGFPDADSAQQFFDQAKPRWSACANRPLTVTPPGDGPVTWSLGELVATDTTLAIRHTLDGGIGFVCQRAKGVRNNIIIDTLWCGFDTANQADEVVTKIAAAVSA